VARSWTESSSVLVGYGDVWVPFRAWQRLMRRRGPCLVAARVSDASEFGRLTLRGRIGRLRLVGVREKDGKHTPGLVVAGLYRLPREIFELVSELERSPRGEIELPPAVVAYSQNREPVEVIVARRWVDVGDVGRLKLASRFAREDSR
jgi:dTDP-glucose pyrophosphorylase